MHVHPTLLAIVRRERYRLYHPRTFFISPTDHSNMNITLLTFVHEHRPRYFDADHDIEVYDENDETWEPLGVSPYSLSDFVEQETNTGQPSPAPFRIASDEAAQYLEYCQAGEIGDKLHAADELNRTRLVAFAEAGYTSVDDLLGTADAVDIERDTGVDRDIIQSVAGWGFQQSQRHNDSDGLRTYCVIRMSNVSVSVLSHVISSVTVPSTRTRAEMPDSIAFPRRRSVSASARSSPEK
jgi:hypothetical protein